MVILGLSAESQPVGSFTLAFTDTGADLLDANGDKIALCWDIIGTGPLEDLGELPTGKIESEAQAASDDARPG